MEGDPFALDGGLEYLFGVTEIGAGGEPEYRAFWAHDERQEQRAFEDFVDFVMKRRAGHPELHVYHYAPYEPNAMKKLMGRHARVSTRSTSCCAARCSSTSTRPCASGCASGSSRTA